MLAYSIRRLALNQKVVDLSPTRGSFFLYTFLQQGLIIAKRLKNFMFVLSCYIKVELLFHQAYKTHVCYIRKIVSEFYQGIPCI